MVLTLSGKDDPNNWNLSGKNNSTKSNIPHEIKILKIKIMNTCLLPLLSKQWKIMKNNMFLIETFRQKINFYYNSFKIDELLLYKDIINICELLLIQSSQLEETEKRIYNSNTSIPNISLIYETSMIKLKPEFEIYDNIYGKPTRANKQIYIDERIKEIQKLMIMDNITFDKIKNYMETKYSVNKN